MTSSCVSSSETLLQQTIEDSLSKLNCVTQMTQDQSKYQLKSIVVTKLYDFIESLSSPWYKLFYNFNQKPIRAYISLEEHNIL